MQLMPHRNRKYRAPRALPYVLFAGVILAIVVGMGFLLARSQTSSSQSYITENHARALKLRANCAKESSQRLAAPSTEPVFLDIISGLYGPADLQDTRPAVAKLNQVSNNTLNERDVQITLTTQILPCREAYGTKVLNLNAYARSLRNQSWFTRTLGGGLDRRLHITTPSGQYLQAKDALNYLANPEWRYDTTPN